MVIQNLQQKKTECRLHSFLAECFLDLHETDSRVFWHSEISVEKTAKLDSGIKPESSMKSKPGDKVWEKFWEGSSADLRDDNFKKC